MLIPACLLWCHAFLCWQVCGASEAGPAVRVAGMEGQMAHEAAQVAYTWVWLNLAHLARRFGCMLLLLLCRGPGTGTDCWHGWCGGSQRG